MATKLSGGFRPPAVRHDAGKFPVIGRGHADYAAILLGDARNAADVVQGGWRRTQRFG